MAVYYMAIVVFIMPMPAMAYLDPFSGSLIIQGLIAGALMAMYFVKRKWNQLKQFFGFGTAEDLEDIVDKKDDASGEESEKNDSIKNDAKGE